MNNLTTKGNTRKFSFDSEKEKEKNDKNVEPFKKIIPSRKFSEQNSRGGKSIDNSNKPYDVKQIKSEKSDEIKSKIFVKKK